jgi:hypothetical protein
VVERGRLRLRRWTVAGGALCDVDLDLRQAQIQGWRTALTVLVGLGNVDVYVPENVNVTVWPGDHGETTRGLQARQRELPP